MFHVKADFKSSSNPLLRGSIDIQICENNVDTLLGVCDNPIYDEKIIIKVKWLGAFGFDPFELKMVRSETGGYTLRGDHEKLKGMSFRITHRRADEILGSYDLPPRNDKGTFAGKLKRIS